MQRPDEKKRRQIAATAARLFASRPFHKVKLDDVAAEAGVGKGTLYVYFKSKEDLYYWLIHDAFSQLVGRLERQLEGGAFSASEALREIVAGLVKFGFDNPQMFELIRSAGPIVKDPRWPAKRQELVTLVERTIRRGNESGEFSDPHPEITALCIPVLMRSVMLFGPKGLDERVVSAQLSRLVEMGVCRKDESGNGMKTHSRRNVAVATGRNGR